MYEKYIYIRVLNSRVFIQIIENNNFDYVRVVNINISYILNHKAITNRALYFSKF